MASIPHLDTYWRCPRVRLAEVVPAVLRLPDGRPYRGKLETISLTGGLLTMPNILDPGSRAKLMFLTRMGPVAAAAEMLSPVSTTRQPFRFIAIEEGDHRRLRAMVQSFLNSGDDWIAKYRAATAHQQSRQGAVRRRVLGSLVFLTVIGSAIYVLGVHLLR
jgi:hypothetical protein